MERKKVLTSNLPLVIDLDGTLTPTDTLLESVIKLVKQSPLNIVRLARWLLKGKAEFKGLVAANSFTSPETLPYRDELLDYLSQEKESGRQLVLATASHKIVAEGVSQHLGIFDEIIATDSINLKGKNKLDAIQNAIGEEFVYAGDSAADIPIWKTAKAAVLVGASASTAKTIRQIIPIEAEFHQKQVRLHTLAKALRIHQWLKNLLVFVPMLTAFSFMDTAKLINSVIAFFAFSLAASATYLVNDILDLDSDRAHSIKRFRPLASAQVTISSALIIAGACLMTALGMAWMVSTQFLEILVLYLIITTSYSWILKQYVLIDVIVLSLLYTIRIIAGSIAISVITSTWLLAFSLFFFFSLALVKRCSELVSLDKAGIDATSGRDYRVGDLTVLWPLGIGAAICSVVVFGLFISSEETVARYASPHILWLIAIGLIYWLSRLWLKTTRGEMHHDPVVYAIKNSTSRTVILLMVAIMIAAHYHNFGNLI